MDNIKLTLSYDGTDLLGWQKTPLGNTVEESLEKALGQILQEKISLQAASRTDAGVHAEGQVVNFFTEKAIPLKRLQKSLNALLPKQITILQIEKVKEDFHPTLQSLGKEYHYYICNTPYQKPRHRHFSWQVPHLLDLKKIDKAIPSLLGTHNFSSFCNEFALLDKNPVCTLYSLEVEIVEENRLCFKVKGDRFLFRMVRNLIGTLVYVGLGKISFEEIPSILISHQRKNAGVTAPCHGLHLFQVFYA